MKKPKLKRNIKNAILLIFLGIVAIFSGCYVQRKENYKNEFVDVSVSVVNTEKVYTASMVMVGDALIHATVYKAYAKNNTYDFTNMFKYISPIVKEYDLAYYNQETILGGKDLGLSTYPQFNSPTEVGTGFVNAGFNLVSLATNHTLDGKYRYGVKAITNSRNFWDQQEGVIAAGSYTSKETRDEVVIKEVNGIKYGLLSYTVHTNGLTVPSGKDYVVNIYSEAKVKEDVIRYRDKVDFLMVAMHWGDEYVHYPTTSQKNMAKYIASLGVDMIIGTHPHVVQPITYVGKTLVIYSLGNFVSSQIGVERLTGLMASVLVKKTEYHGKTSITFENIVGDLIYTNKSNKYVVYPYSELNNSILNNYKNYYTKYSNYVTAYSKEVTMRGL